MSSDDPISYLDIGDAILAGQWQDVINGYWSPLYPALLGVATHITGQMSSLEFLTVKLVNLAITTIALGAFTFLLSQLIRFSRLDHPGTEPGEGPIPERAWLISGYALFIWAALAWTDVRSDTPDMLVAALFYSACAFLLRIRIQPDRWKPYALLAVALALGYLAKSVMFPIALVTLTMAAVIEWRHMRTLRRSAIAGFVFFLLAGPYLGALSIEKGRLTFGDSGKLNYQWIVVGEIAGWRHWQGQPPHRGTPVHPTRQIHAQPEAYEFGKPVGGTYPPWFDPSYWYEGLETTFIPSKQRWTIEKNMARYSELFLGYLLFGIMALGALRGNPKAVLRDISRGWFLIIPAAAGLAAYMIGAGIAARGGGLPHQPHTRYIAPFIVALFAGGLCGLRVPDSPLSRRLVLGMTTSLALILAVQLGYSAVGNLQEALRNPRSNIQWEIARKLHALGIRPKDPVAVLGWYGQRFHWTRLARVRVVAEAPAYSAYVNSTPQVQTQVLDAIMKTGARIVVQQAEECGAPPTAPCPQAPWQPLGHHYYALFFR